MSGTVTITGGTNVSSPPQLATLDSQANANLAQTLLSSVNNDIADGWAGTYRNNPLYPSSASEYTAVSGGNAAKHTGIGESVFFIKNFSSGPQILTAASITATGQPTNTVAIIDNSTQADTIYGGNAPDQILLIGNHPTNAASVFGAYFTNNGVGTVIAGGGNDYIQTSSTVTGVGGGHVVIVGDGNDTINSTTGNDTITLGDGNDVVSVGGTNSDIINAGGGADTIYVSAGATASVSGGAGPLTFINSNNSATVLGNTGAITVDGGTGGGLYEGGTNGNNSLVGGQSGSNTTLFGGGSGDTLQAAGGNTTLLAGAGNETLVGNAASGADSFVFNANLVESGATYIISDFTVGKDTIVFAGYDDQPGFNPVTSVTWAAGSNNTTEQIGLSDGTTIEIKGLQQYSALGGGSFNYNS